ncbi:tyrosine-type recombinase/integrase [Bacteroides sp. 519]|uniref:tyrosine-type recombinase/integrase n=1 Tax=Bacteroides sp. 519 TaxID=2302937 RepID=UPI0013D785A8|nr:tyrosine-type recombinase/integrase [Bacteroides sp. 519]
MDITNLKENYQYLVDYLIKNDYCKDLVYKTQKCIQLALDIGSSLEITSYEDLFYYEVKRQGYKPNEQRYKAFRCYLGNVKRFDETGEYPSRMKSTDKFPAVLSVYSQLNAEYQFIVKRHLEVGGLKGKMPQTVRNEARATMRFFKHLQDSGAYSLNEVTPEMVYRFFFDGEKQKRGRDYCSQIKRALESAKALMREPIQRLQDFLPSIKSGNKNFQYLTPEESRKIRECLEDEKSQLTHIERSVGWILYFLGLRGTDIVSLSAKDIDWKRNRIRITQSKTDQPLSLPMNAAIGNELFDYITTERPASDINTILITKRSPHRSFKDLRSIITRIFEKAGVRIEGGPIGPRVFRHHLVTFLLSRGVDCDVVSSIVGHASPESIKHYADADIEHLRECSISVQNYPISSKLFKI